MESSGGMSDGNRDCDGEHAFGDEGEYTWKGNAEE